MEGITGTERVYIDAFEQTAGLFIRRGLDFLGKQKKRPTCWVALTRCYVFN